MNVFIECHQLLPCGLQRPQGWPANKKEDGVGCPACYDDCLVIIMFIVIIVIILMILTAPIV